MSVYSDVRWNIRNFTEMWVIVSTFGTVYRLTHSPSHKVEFGNTHLRDE